MPLAQMVRHRVARRLHRVALAGHDRALLREPVAQLGVDRALRDPPPRTVRRLVEEASPWADSGLETFVIIRLRWLGLPIRVQIWISGHRVDFLIGERLVLQVDGGHHVGAQRAEDIRHDAELMLLGYHVIRVGYDQVMNRWPDVQEQIMHAIAQGLHRA